MSDPAVVQVPGLDPAAHLLLTRAGDVVTVTLDRPAVHNAQTPATWRGLREIGRWLPGDVRVVVLKGSGRSFSSGLDRTVLAQGAGASLEDIDTYQQGFTWLRDPSIVSIAAVQGYALGAGCQLALSCDLRVLAHDAQLALPEPSLGLVPDLTGTHPLVHAVGYSRALEMCLTGRKLGADEALRIGLANLVVPGEDLASAVEDLVAAVLAPLRGAVIETKALLQQAVTADFETQRAAERAAQSRRFADLAELLGS